jgi:hypothetical protein
MEKILFIAISAVCVSSYALPTYEPFTEYSALITAGGGSVDLGTSGFYVTNGPVVEQWGGGSSGFGLFFSQGTPTATAYQEVIVTNNPATVFTSANLATILPANFPGAGSDINITAYIPQNAGANTAGNSAVLKFAQDIPRPTNGVTTVYMSYLLNCPIKGTTVGAGNVGRYVGCLAATNTYEGTGSGGAYPTWASLFNTFGTTTYVSYGMKTGSPTITSGNDILASDSFSGNSPGTGNAGVGVVYNTPNFVVGCFTFSSSGNDTNTVWVNPPTSDFGGATPSSVNFNTYPMKTVMSDVDAFFMESRSGGATGGASPSFLGNLLIGTTWSYVTGGPEFTNRPVNVATSMGGTASFTGDAVAAAQSVSYQWQHVVGSVTNNVTDTVGGAGGGATVSGSGTDTLTLTGLTAGDIAGSYQLVATASDTGFKLASQTVKILTDPFVDSSPGNISVNYGRTATFMATAETTQPTLSYQWYLGSNPLTNGVQANGSTVSGASGTVSGPTLTTTLTIANVSYSDDGNYSVVVTNNVNNAAQSAYGTLTVIATSPMILSQLPLGHTNQFDLLVGADPTFSITADGALPIYYQWYSNNVAMSGATNSNLNLNNMQTSSSGSYYCLLSNFIGTVFSATQNVSVASVGAPYPSSVMALNPLGYWRLNEGPDDGGGNQFAICFDYARGNNGLYTNVSLAQPGYSSATDPLLTSAQFGLTGLSAGYDSYAGWIQDVDFSAPIGNSVAFSVEAWENGLPETPDAAIVAKESYGNGGEQFVLDVHKGVYRFFVRDASGTAHAVSSTVSPGYGQWHHLAGICDESNGFVKLYVDGALSGTVAIAPGSGILSANNFSIGSRMSVANTNYNDQLHGNVNDVAVFGSALSATQVATQYFAAGIAPSFTQQPASSVNANQNGTLTVLTGVTGTAPLVYQWYDDNTSLPLTGQTNATLLITNIQSSGAYYLTATNLYGSTNSTVVYVALNSGAPVIVQDLPPSVATMAGRTYTYAVEIQGTEPFTYTWYKNSSQIGGQTASSYVLNAASGSYDVAVSNIDGGVISTVSTMSAVPPSTDPYSTNILGLNPVGYWPLEETNAPGAANLETNYGTLGSLGTAYYAGTNTPGVTFGQGGALSATGDYDSSVGFLGGNSSSYLFVPLKTAALYLKPPLTFECWINSTSTTLADLIGDGGANGDGSGLWSGIRISYNPGFSGGPTLTAYTYAPGSNANTYTQINAAANTLPFGAWNHCVVTYDGNNLLLYVNGALQGSGTVSMATNYWSPITIGTGRWTSGSTRGYKGLLDEAAVYTNILTATQITNHYLAGTIYGSNYMQTVENDQPLLYYRMDNVYTAPDPTVYPTAVNYGTAPVNGAYGSGIMPGGVSGSTDLGKNAVAAPINGAYSCVDAGYDSSFNPTGSQPFTAMTWFKTYPADERMQTVMSQGNNWALNLNTVSAGGQILWNLSNGSQVSSTNTLNDEQWHFVAGVYDGTNSFLYLDGALNNSTPAAGGLIGEPITDVFLGGDADNTFEQNFFGSRYFAGAIAQAAFYTNALSAAQIGKIYNVAAIPTINLSYSGGQVVIIYTGTLLSSTNVAGPYSQVIGATTSPYTVAPTRSVVFYRSSN